MKQEDKDLLLRYLSMALPYKVMIKYKGTFGEEPEPMTLFNLNCVVANLHYEVEGCKPYLKPMSSMTEEEYEEYAELRQDISDKLKDWKCADLIDWLNKHHFDYRGLIERGLALEVTKENNPYNIKEE